MFTDAFLYPALNANLTHAQRRQAKQPELLKAGKTWRAQVAISGAPPPEGAAKKTHLVVFVGGCTVSEVAAVRALSTETNRYVVVTTGIITGDSFIGALQTDWKEPGN